jgi:hypothetical protein
MKSQNQQILNHLRNFGSITPIVALRKFGCFRLAARINDLRNQGFPIETDIITYRKKKYAKYRYADQSL